MSVSRTRHDLVWSLAGLVDVVRSHANDNARAELVVRQVRTQLANLGGPVVRVEARQGAIAVDGEVCADAPHVVARLSEAMEWRAFATLEFAADAEADDLLTLARFLCAPPSEVVPQRGEPLFAAQAGVTVVWAGDERSQPPADAPTAEPVRDAAPQPVFVIEPEAPEPEPEPEDLELPNRLEDVFERRAPTDIDGAAPAEDLVAHALTLGGQADTVRPFLAACARRDDAPETLVQFVRLQLGGAWRTELARALLALAATPRVDGPSRLCDAALLAPDVLKLLLGLDPLVVQTIANDLVSRPASPLRSALFAGLAALGTSEAFAVLAETVEPSRADAELRETVTEFALPEAADYLRAVRVHAEVG